MLTRRLMIACLAFTPALAAERAFFDKDDFEKAQAEGKRILVEVSAPWCPTCKAQAPIIKKYSDNSFVIFMVDFDTQKEELKYLNARSQSTLIMYKGKVETARSAGDTTDAGIAKLIKSSL
jgi:thioredoxin 1